MNKPIVVTVLLILGWAHAAGAADSPIALALPNMREPQPHRIVSGAISAADLGRLRAAGVKHLIDLRSAEEIQGFDEGAIAAGLGLDYHSIPIKAAQSLTRENVARLDELLKKAGDEPTLVHCGSGNRVGALIALRAAWMNGRSTEVAIAEGKTWGLTSLEPAVRGLLENASAP